MPGDGETLARESPMARHFNVRPSAHMHWEPTVDRASVSNPHSRPASIGERVAYVRHPVQIDGRFVDWYSPWSSWDSSLEPAWSAGSGMLKDCGGSRDAADARRLHTASGIISQWRGPSRR